MTPVSSTTDNGQADMSNTTRLLLLHKGLKGKASTPTDDHMHIPLTPSRRNHHSIAFQTPAAGTDIYKGSFFQHTNRDQNALLESVISSAEVADDCVVKFVSLVRARDFFAQLQVLVNNCQFRRLPVLLCQFGHFNSKHLDFLFNEGT